MRVSQSTRQRAEKARQLYAENGNLSKTARELGIHRSTLDRWAREGLLTPEPVVSEEEDEVTIDSLVQKAMGILDEALSGGKINNAQIRAAIEVTKASNALRAQAKAEQAKKSLAELIAEEDEFDSD